MNISKTEHQLILMEYFNPVSIPSHFNLTEKTRYGTSIIESYTSTQSDRKVNICFDVGRYYPCVSFRFFKKTKCGLHEDRDQSDGPSYVRVSFLAKYMRIVRTTDYCSNGQLHYTLKDRKPARTIETFEKDFYSISALWAKRGNVIQTISLSIDNVNFK